VFGPSGRGVAEQAGVLDEVDFIVGTFSKSLGSMGGFAASNHPGFEMLRLSSRPYMFTASLSPANLAAASACLHELRSRPELRSNLWRNAHALHDGLSSLGLQLTAPPSSIVAVRVPTVELAVAFWNRLFDAGVYVNLAIPPGTPNSTSLLRCSVSAAQTPEQITRICDTFRQVAKDMDLLQPTTSA
jgi:8-amino-7-oxononanoate synthase